MPIVLYHMHDYITKSLIEVSLSEPHHLRSTVKSVFLLACLFACLLAYLLDTLPYMAKNCLSANQHYIEYMEC